MHMTKAGPNRLKVKPTICDFCFSFYQKKLDTDFRVIKTNEKILNLNLFQRGKAIRMSGHHHKLAVSDKFS